MSNPKFHIGQDVAVCSPCLMSIIPITKVTGRRFVPNHIPVHPITGIDGTKQQAWLYTVEHGYMDGESEYREICLRPINPDTEYLEDETKVTAKS